MSSPDLVPVHSLPELRGPLVSPEDWIDPYRVYQELRTSGLMYLLPETDEVACLGWNHCEALLRHPDFSSNASHRRPAGTNPDQAARMPNRRLLARPHRFPVMTFMDPPEHTRIRSLVSRAFTPRTVERLRPHVVSVIASLLDGADSHEFDVVEDFARPLPLMVICELLGVPYEDREKFGPWTTDLLWLIESSLDEPRRARGMTSFVRFLRYLDDLFEQRRLQPQDDLISALLSADENGDRLVNDEVRSIVMLLLVAGQDTTMNLLGNGVVALLQNPGQWAALCGDASLAPAAVEEVLRFNGPFHATMRFATSDTQLGGVAIEKGQCVVAVLAAANRDPQRFDAPDRFDISRRDQQHLTFSHGLHYCLGAALARLQGQEGLLALSHRFPRMRLVESPHLRENFVLRGFSEVRVTTR